MTKETDPQRESYETGTPEAIRQYFKEGAYKVAISHARRDMIPTIDIITPEDIKSLDQMAKLLASVEDTNENFKSINPETDQGKFDLAVETESRGITVAEQVADPNVKKKIRETVNWAVDEIFDSVSKVASKIGGSKGILVLSGVAFALTSCSPVSIAEPLTGSIERIPSIPTSEIQTSPTPTELTPTPDNPYPYAAIEQSQDFQPDAVYTGETLKYDGTSEYVINEINEKYGISIISPATWGSDNEANRPWSPVAIDHLAKTIKKLPAVYLNNSRTPKQILLFNLPSQDKQLEGGLTAGYGYRQITMSIPISFDPMAPTAGTYQEHFGSQEFLLEAFVVHEFTHAFTEAHPEVLEQWIKEMGWHWDGQKWTNENPSRLIHESGADIRPVEDIAVSTSLLWSNPAFLSPDRLSFFLKDQNFKDWQPVKALVLK